ncbi:hypothetical protein [Streptomyces sp.]|uniref:hypothetical protein n=1 Tax=Streptomyces sp. TaxID=1931 RepID=UPI002F3FE485
MTSPPTGPGVHTVSGGDTGSANLREADHLIHHLATALDLPTGTVACTHLING